LLSVGLVVSLAVAIIGVLRAFGVGVSVEQEGAVVEFLKSSYEIAIIIGGFLFARNFVFSQQSVEKLTGRVDPIVPEVPVAPDVAREIRAN
jgi:hypothetical protein